MIERRGAAPGGELNIPADLSKAMWRCGLEPMASSRLLPPFLTSPLPQTQRTPPKASVFIGDAGTRCPGTSPHAGRVTALLHFHPSHRVDTPNLSHSPCHPAGHLINRMG